MNHIYRVFLSLFVLRVVCLSGFAATPTPIYLWFEPEWFEGVEGGFGYWAGPSEYKATGKWGIAGPGISAEWSQGGESEWQSMGVCPQETKAECRRDLVVPRAGKYRVWVRYVDHRKKTEPFAVAIRQNGKDVLAGELGAQPVAPVNDEYQLYWGFSFGWGSLEGNLNDGPAQLALSINKAGEEWRQVDAVLITNDLDYTPVGREKPAFAYIEATQLQPANGAAWRGSAKDLAVGANWKRGKLGNKDFSMWVQIVSGAVTPQEDDKWWSEQNVDALTLPDVFFFRSAPRDIREAFAKQYAASKNAPLMNWPNLFPGLYLGVSPDLSPNAPRFRWLARTKTPFFIMTNYSSPAYTATNGPPTLAALTGPLAGQFLGYIHGEAISHTGIGFPSQPLGKTRREHLDLLIKQFLSKQKEQWGKIYKCEVPENHWNKGISCLSCQTTALSHLFCESGAEVVGYEECAGNVHVPMRIAFERGAARQYGRAWINYASGNFGDACTYFTQQPIGARGAQSWFHSKYAITDGPSIGWYRKLYYLNHLGGASAVYWEQGLENQWILPGPGTHPIQLSPFGRATADFQEFVDRLPDRGEPYTPIAILLSYGHGYDRENYSCKMLDLFREDKNDIELRELFNVCWYPSGVVEGLPSAPDVQSMPSGIYGNIFDVLVDRPARIKAIHDYPVVIAAGDVDLAGNQAALDEYVRKGGTLVANIAAAKGLPPKWLGAKPTGKTTVAEEWSPDGQQSFATTPFEVAGVELDGAEVLVWATPKTPLIARNKVGAGAVILTLAPHNLGLDERAHPALAHLMNGLTEKLLPVEVGLPNGQRLDGEIMYQVNKTKDGWLVLLVNNRGVDKTPNGVARVDRRAFVDIVVRTALPVKSAREYTQPRDLSVEQKGGTTEIRLRIHPGDIQVVGLVTGPR